MFPIQNSKSFRHFAKHLFLIGKVYLDRNKAKNDIDSHLVKMRNSILKMRLSYTDVDVLQEKIDSFISKESKYSKFFKPEDKEMQELKSHVSALEQELMNEKIEKQKIIEENNEKIKQLTESLKNIKSKMKNVLIESARRQQRLKALDNKIRQKVDAHRYFHPH